MESIPVKTSARSYEVLVGEGVLELLPAKLEALFRDRFPQRIAVVSDTHVAPLHAARVKALLERTGAEVSLHLFPAGEPSKTLETVAMLLNRFGEAQLTRKDLVVALGGGVVGDVAGFAAAVYLRGIPVVQLPTSFLAAIDSSVGGKTGVDLPGGKNLCGAFWQPSLVICEKELLRTLPEEFLQDGCGEAIKYGVIRDRFLFDLLAKEELAACLDAVIARCVAIKAEIVGRDEFDRGERALLNFGHTIGHAIEKCSEYRLSHGRAVGVGMVLMSRAAFRLGWSTEDCTPAIEAALRRFGLPTQTMIPPGQLLAAMQSDKKRGGDSITLVVPERLGHCVPRVCPVAELPRLFV